MLPLTNRLALEQSPYLLQHKDNPIFWQAWSEEIFSVAQQLDRPIFLSIGYATCHWCHVMEKQSFENEQIAKIINDNFIAIKVDREERPDIDAVFMNVCHLMNTRGGWPLTIVMTPDKKPYFAATYIPPFSNGHRLGLNELLPRLADFYHHEKNKLAATTQQILQLLQQENKTVTEENISFEEIFSVAQTFFTMRYDQDFGGFNEAPKFLSAHNLLFLLSRAHSQKDSSLSDMVLHTLNEVRLGGVYDQIGLGMHRYSADRHWFAPHFEKMLYDQAMLLWLTVDAYRFTQHEFYKNIGKEIVEYIFSEMQDPQGGFFSATDADSEGEEGLFFLWEYSALEKLLTKEELLFLQEIYDLNEHGNFFDEASGHNTGLNHFAASEKYSRFDIEEFYRKIQSELFQSVRRKIYAARQTKPKPFLDDKILADINALMLSALYRYAMIDDDSDLKNNIDKNQQFLLDTFVKDDFSLWRRHRRQQTGIEGFVDDYAFTVHSLLMSFLTNFDFHDLALAEKITAQQIEILFDKKNGGFCISNPAKETLPITPKEFYDGAYPCGNSISLYNLALLYLLCGKELYRDYAQKIVWANQKGLQSQPAAHSMSLLALELLQDDVTTLIVAAEKKSTALAGVQKIQKMFLPKVIVVAICRDNILAAENFMPYAAKINLQEQAQYLLCQNQTCQLPTSNFQEVLQKL